MRYPMSVCGLVFIAASIKPTSAQSIDSVPTHFTPMAATSATVVPMLVRYDGVAVQGDGKPKTGEGTATFLVYRDENGGDPMWIETESVRFDPSGKYEVYLGSASSSGLPPDLFGTGEARWLEVQIAGQSVGPRTLLTSVPYALKAADAATLGGLPASAFVLASSITGTAPVAPQTITPEVSASNVTTTGGTNFYLPKFNAAATVINSQIYDNGTSVGIGDVPNASARLDVNGAMIMRGNMQVTRTGNATTSTGYPSWGFQFYSNAYNSSSKANDNPYFQLQSEPTGNDTASPSATFNLLFANNGSKPAETGFSINPNGTINFASGQTFPGTGSGTITGVTAGSGLTGGGTSGNIILGLSAGVVEASSGTSNYLPIFTGSNTLASSEIYDTGTSVGIGDVPSSGAKLDVNGATTLRGNMTVSGTGNATSSTAYPSFGVDFTSSAYNSSTQAIDRPYFQLQSEPTGNDTSTPSATLNVLFSNAASIPTETGLSINPDGTIKFASGQTLPATTSSATAVDGTSSSGIGVEGTSSSNVGIAGYSTTSSGIYGNTVGNTGNTAGVAGQAGSGSGMTGNISGVWGDSYSHIGVLGTSNQQPGVQGTSVSAQGVQGNSTSGNGVHGVSTSTSGVFGETSSTSAQDAAVYGYSHNGAQGMYGFSASNTGVQGTSTSATGVAGTSTSANGILGYTAGGTTNTAGVLGGAGGSSGNTGNISGVWGDAYSHIGVLGTSNQYAGVSGVSVSGVGVVGQSTSNSGMQGTSNSATGMAGTSTSGDGMLGYTGGGTGNTGGVVGQAGGVSGYGGIAGVWGDARTHVGVLGTSSEFTGVEGISGSSYGVQGTSNADVGVFGMSTLDAGLVGIGGSSTQQPFDCAICGVWGDVTGSNGQNARAVYGTATDGYGAFLTNNSSLPTLYAYNYGSGSDTDTPGVVFRAFEASTPDGTCGFGSKGTLTCTGQLKSLATTASGSKTVETYSMQSPENWMEDFGFGTLQNGVATISIETGFAETVSGSADYHVFLTPNGDSKGLYVFAKTATSFEVRESGGGTSTLDFDYRIVAKRRGFEAQRMVDVTEAMKAVNARKAESFAKAAKTYRSAK